MRREVNLVSRDPAAIVDLEAATLVVHLHRDADHCTASFDGSLTNTTRGTIEGLVDLLAGEESVVLDFSRIDIVDNHGSDAVEGLVDSIRVRGAQLRVDDPVGRMRGSLRGFGLSRMDGSGSPC